MPARFSFAKKSTALLIALTLSCAAFAALKTDKAKSSISAVFRQMNVPIEGKFRKFNAQIDYDAAKPAASRANVDIDMAGFDLGDVDFNKEVAKKDWFNTAQFPKATFVSSEIKPAAAGKLDVKGKLTIKGTTADVGFPMTVRKEGALQVFEGTLPIKRLTFNIGEGEWRDTSAVADEVTIRFRVVAAQ